ncbi:hypothetical protein Zm00014a_017031 [Zea mays]|jgi:hypothetical protein|uniref:Uncharacterized protein n=1 Tax=Zea mays TaxID=4577 RepID=A0A3L6DBU4_MAIZE|nr:hypothetical protein Zm00014a_017031 [Zea mays]
MPPLALPYGDGGGKRRSNAGASVGRMQRCDHGLAAALQRRRGGGRRGCGGSRADKEYVVVAGGIGDLARVTLRRKLSGWGGGSGAKLDRAFDADDCLGFRWIE